jgi:hypothetical protein
VTHPIEDKDFDEYLSGRSQVSRQYRDLDSAEVPAHLDEAVLAQARDAVNANSSAPRDELALVRNKRMRLMRWAVPTTLAACSLLVVSIVIRSGSQHEVKPQQTTASAPMAAPSAPEAKAVDSAPDADKEREQVILIAPPRNAVTEFSPLAPPPEIAAARAERSREEMQRAQRQSIAADTEQVHQELRKSLSIAPPPEMNSADQTFAATVAPASPAFESAPAPKAAVPAPAPAATPQRAEIQPQPQMSGEEEDLSEIAVTGVRQKSSSLRMSGPRGTISAARASDAVAENEGSVSYENPEAWLEHIRQLRREGRSADADREWRDFRKQHPDVVVAKGDLARGDDQR